MSAKIAIRNVLQPGKTYNVDAAKYEAMKAAVLKAAPKTAPGFTPAEFIEAVKPRLPAELFPGGGKAGWWFKAVQLDLEAKGVLVRAGAKPLRLHKA